MKGRQALSSRAFWFAIILALLASAAHWEFAHADQIVHTVQPGENLFRIGLKYGIGWTAIMQANSLPNATIYVGQQLVIPVGGSATSPVSASPPQPLSAPASTGAYVVQRGDTLARIAARFGLTTAQLAGANNIYNPSLIYVGQSLIIPGAAAVPAPATSPTGGKLILVDLSEQHMYVYQGGSLIYSFVVSTGQPGRDTRPGSFSVLNKIPNAYASTWDLWMPNWLGIYWAGSLQNGIHGLPILSNGLRLWEGYLGSRVSYGCVILGLWEAQTLYEWAEVGTPVNIQY